MGKGTGDSENGQGDTGWGDRKNWKMLGRGAEEDLETLGGEPEGTRGHWMDGEEELVEAGKRGKSWGTVHRGDQDDWETQGGGRALPAQQQLGCSLLQAPGLRVV